MYQLKQNHQIYQFRLNARLPSLVLSLNYFTVMILNTTHNSEI